MIPVFRNRSSLDKTRMHFSAGIQFGHGEDALFDEISKYLAKNLSAPGKAVSGECVRRDVKGDQF